MRLLTAAALFALAPAALSADPPALRGVETSDLDRAVAPCADFYEFANGAWRSANPIPPSMVRWSRRWAAGESAKDRLKVILDEASASTAWPKGSVNGPTPPLETPPPRRPTEESRAGPATATPAPRGWRGETSPPPPFVIRHAFPMERRLPYLQRVP